jgi:hypothetical protein
LTETLQFYGADKGKAPGPVASVAPEQLAKWALETELQDGFGTQKQGGRWTVRYGSYSEAETLTLYDQFNAAGYAAKVMPLRADGGYRYEVRLGQLVTEREARSLADRLARDLHVPAPTLSRH